MKKIMWMLLSDLQYITVLSDNLNGNVVVKQPYFCSHSKQSKKVLFARTLNVHNYLLPANAIKLLSSQ